MGCCAGMMLRGGGYLRVTVLTVTHVLNQCLRISWNHGRRVHRWGVVEALYHSYRDIIYSADCRPWRRIPHREYQIIMLLNHYSFQKHPSGSLLSTRSSGGFGCAASGIY